jgi:short-subunit dehydrogenase
MRLQNKVIVVTGGGSGIGRALTMALLARGARVAIVDRNEETLQETAKIVGADIEKISLHTLDITNLNEVQALPDKIIQKHGTIDGLINNAGIIQPFLPINDLSYEAIEKVLQVNFYGTLYLTKTLLPFLIHRPEAHIANVSSMGGFLPVPGQAVYGASKAAVKLFTEALYAELLDSPVRVSVIFPGAVATNITVNSGVDVPNTGSENKSFKALPAEKAANIILDGIEKDQYRILVGSDARFMDLLSRLNPAYATRFIAKKMRALLKK